MGPNQEPHLDESLSDTSSFEPFRSFNFETKKGFEPLDLDTGSKEDLADE